MTLSIFQVEIEARRARARDAMIVRGLAWVGLALVALSFLLGLAGALQGCRPASSPETDTSRRAARAAILTVAQAVSETDKLCARVAFDRQAWSLAAKCDTAYVQIRADVIEVSSMVDTWDDVASGKETAICLAGDALRTLVSVYDQVHAVDPSTKIPVILDDAIALTSLLGPCQMGAAQDAASAQRAIDHAPTPDAATGVTTVDAGADAGDAGQ